MPTRCREIEEIAQGRRRGVATSNHSDGPPPRAVWWQEGGDVVPEHIGDLMKVFIGRNQRRHQASSEVIRELISRNQRSHQPQSEVSSAAIRGLISRTESKKTSLARLETGGCASARSWRSPSAGAPPRPRKLPDDGRNQ
jgi:hypothetical protein